MSIAQRRMTIAALVAIALNLLLFSILSGTLHSGKFTVSRPITHLLSVRFYTPPKPKQVPQVHTASRIASIVGPNGKTAANLAAGGKSGGAGSAIVVTGPGGTGQKTPTAASAPHTEAPIDMSKVFVPHAPPLPTKRMRTLPVRKIASVPQPNITMVNPSKRSNSKPAAGGPTSTPQKIASAIIPPTVVPMPPTKPLPTDTGADYHGLSMDKIPSPGDTGTGVQPGVGTGTAGADIGSGSGTGTGSDSGVGTGVGKSGQGDGAFGAGKYSGAGGGERHIVYVLDVSLSMDMVKIANGRTRLQQAKSEIIDAIDALKPDETFDIILFSGRTSVYRSALTPADLSDVNDASVYLGNARPDDGTDIEGALLTALKIEGVNTIVLITDGEPTQGDTNTTVIARRIREANSANVRIDTVGLLGKDPDGNDLSQEGRDLLKRIADDSGGTARFVQAGRS